MPFLHLHKQCHMDPMSQNSLILWDHHPIWDLPLRQMLLCGVWMHFWVFLCLWEMLVCTLLSVRFCLIFMLGWCHLEWVKFRFSGLTYWTCIQMFGWVLVSPSSSSIYISMVPALTPWRKGPSHGPLPWGQQDSQIMELCQSTPWDVSTQGFPGTQHLTKDPPTWP
jgi:hypothetical protein